MAEIEYQVDELLFRMNALTGSHGLPEKPACYLTDSDSMYGGGDDGISSGGSEVSCGLKLNIYPSFILVLIFFHLIHNS